MLRPLVMHTPKSVAGLHTDGRAHKGAISTVHRQARMVCHDYCRPVCYSIMTFTLVNIPDTPCPLPVRRNPAIINPAVQSPCSLTRHLQLRRSLAVAAELITLSLLHTPGDMFQCQGGHRACARLRHFRRPAPPSSRTPCFCHRADGNRAIPWFRAFIIYGKQDSAVSTTRLPACLSLRKGNRHTCPAQVYEAHGMDAGESIAGV
jgi:hypothetical protein